MDHIFINFSTTDQIKWHLVFPFFLRWMAGQAGPNRPAQHRLVGVRYSFCCCWSGFFIFIFIIYFFLSFFFPMALMTRGGEVKYEEPQIECGTEVNEEQPQGCLASSFNMTTADNLRCWGRRSRSLDQDSWLFSPQNPKVARFIASR